MRTNKFMEPTHLNDFNAIFQDIVGIIANEPINSGHYSFAFLSDLLLKAKDDELTLLKDPNIVLSSKEANIIAAMIEDVCDLKNLTPPSWVSKISPTKEPIFPENMGEKMRLYLLAYGEPIYKRRNIYFGSRINSRV